jgi:hypothetical protein
MKKSILYYLFVCFLFTANFSFSQYCMLPGRTPYSPAQPGITNFKLNTINRTSSNSESPNTVVVTTGLSTTVTAGQTYTISISHSEDAALFPGARNNLRVWVDYNNNFSYTDAGETVLSVDLQPPATTYTATFVVPLSVPAGTLSLRATAKMSADAGHILPSPCDSPADPLGYHGEMEDYKLVVNTNTASGQSPVTNFALSPTVCIASVVTVTNNSTGTPAPTYSWISTPSAGVTFSPNNTASSPAISFSNTNNYTITCIASNSLSSSSTTKTINAKNCTVGLSHIELKNEVIIGPNPVVDFLTIHNIPSEIRNPVITVVNNLGQVVLENQIPGNPGDSVSLNLSGLNNGIYFIKINYGQENIIKQIILNK